MNNKAHLRPSDYDKNGDIIHDSVREDKGDLISRSALKAEVETLIGYSLSYESYEAIINAIDNSPTVKMPTAIVKCDKNGELSIEPLRPKGEWLEPYESKIAQECSICHRQMPAPKWFHFCPNCGADMRGAE